MKSQGHEGGAGASATGDLRASALPLGDEVLMVLSVAIPDRDRGLRLSAAEREVARLAVCGASNDAIAEARATSVRTVANQLASIFRKLGVRSRFELAACLGSES